MNVEPVDLGDEVRVGLQLRLAPAPVVLRDPVARELLHRGQLHALRAIRDRSRLGPACRLDAVAQLGELLFRKNRNLERTNGGLVTAHWSHGLELPRNREDLVSRCRRGGYALSVSGARRLGVTVRCVTPQFGRPQRWPGIAPLSGRSATQNEGDPGQHEFQLLGRGPTDPLGEERSVDRDDLGNVGHRVLGKPGAFRRQEDVARSISPLEIARQRHADHRREAAPVQRIPLNHQDWTAKPRPRAHRIGEIRRSTSPWAVTIPSVRGSAGWPRQQPALAHPRFVRRPDSSPR